MNIAVVLEIQPVNGEVLLSTGLLATHQRLFEQLVSLQVCWWVPGLVYCLVCTWRCHRWIPGYYYCPVYEWWHCWKVPGLVWSLVHGWWRRRWAPGKRGSGTNWWSFVRLWHVGRFKVTFTTVAVRQKWWLRDPTLETSSAHAARFWTQWMCGEEACICICSLFLDLVWSTIVHSIFEAYFGMTNWPPPSPPATHTHTQLNARTHILPVPFLFSLFT